MDKLSRLRGQTRLNNFRDPDRTPAVQGVFFPQKIPNPAFIDVTSSGR